MSPSKVSNVPASRGMNASLADPTVASPTPVYLAATLPRCFTRRRRRWAHWSDAVVGGRGRMPFRASYANLRQEAAWLLLRAREASGL